MQFVRALRQNPHMLNYAVITSASVIPVLLYANSRTPSQESIETALHDNYDDYLQKAKQNTENINKFWKFKRNNQEMDTIYNQLLRSGKSSMKRHEALQGTLNQDTMNQDPDYARTERILMTVPPSSAPATSTLTTTGNSEKKKKPKRIPKRTDTSSVNESNDKDVSTDSEASVTDGKSKG